MLTFRAESARRAIIHLKITCGMGIYQHRLWFKPDHVRDVDCLGGRCFTD